MGNTTGSAITHFTGTEAAKYRIPCVYAFKASFKDICRSLACRLTDIEDPREECTLTRCDSGRRKVVADARQGYGERRSKWEKHEVEGDRRCT